MFSYLWYFFLFWLLLKVFGLVVGYMDQSQSPDSIHQRSNAELLYQLVNTGNVEAIKDLCREGASLEWIDGEGKTPLVMACMNPELFIVAKTLIEFGANVNAYRPGCHGGTPLHHAAERGLGRTVNLLLTHRANVFVKNDDCQTPLGVARIKGYTNVVRAIENHICHFSGWLREFYGPGFLQARAPQWLSRKIWVVVIPCGSNNLMKPLKLELSIYPTLQESKPRTVISLCRANIEEPEFHQLYPALTVFDQSTKTRYKLASASEGDKEQLQWLYNACKGIPQVMPRSATNDRPQVPPNGHQSSESVNTNGLGDSLDNASQNVGPTHSEATSSEWVGPIGNVAQHAQTHDTPPVVQTSNECPASVSSAPSAPPISKEVLDEGPMATSDVKVGGDSSSCVICWEAPIEGACIPCGHMAGCMSCLSEIKAKQGVCPVCRGKINQVTRLYAV